MATLEDEQDVNAARNAQAEANVDMAEFDEKVAAVSKRGNYNGEALSDEYLELLGKMTPIERYAIRFMEDECRPGVEEEAKGVEVTLIILNRNFPLDRNVMSLLGFIRSKKR